ncbi:MAG: hypothetical protein LUG95_06610 [Clostridiales bacterium]|nr:hypothetical protein [Clostridiales bacterium]
MEQGLRNNIYPSAEINGRIFECKKLFYPQLLSERVEKNIHGVCGSKSGRDIDKVKKCNLTPCFDEKAPYFTQADIVLVCRKMAKSKFEPENFIDSAVEKNYPEKDYHYIYYVEIEKVLISD